MRQLTAGSGDERDDLRRDRASALGVTVHLGHNDRTEISAVLERTSLCLSSLT